MANERLLISWLRMGIGLIAVGFVVERIGLLLPNINAEQTPPHEIFGLTLVIRPFGQSLHNLYRWYSVSSCGFYHLCAALADEWPDN
jgi:uncharacterized membrane protein YidH (DUF202 family)